MNSRIPFRRIRYGLLAVAMVAASTSLLGQTGAKDGEWRFWGGDTWSSHYSPLDQINQSNVKDLQIAWRWKAANFGERPGYDWQSTPLMVGGVLYVTAGSRRDVVAIDARTGETLWMFRYDEASRGRRAPNVVATSRGLAYWNDGKGDARLLYVSLGYHLVALDANTGRPIQSFGKNGVVDLFEGLDQVKTPGEGDMAATSPPTIVRNVAVVGGIAAGAGTKTSIAPYPRGFDVKTGKQLWAFHTVPRSGEFGIDTWEKDSWTYTGNTGAWAPMSGDEELGYVYLPTEVPTNDWYGGFRPGNNLFANSILCLDATTGKRIWHFQVVHHDIWDYDVQAAANLVDISVGGKKIKALAQVTKVGLTFILDRVTGQPVWPIEERPVPQSDVPGEKTSPTQPFPTKPANFERVGITSDDLIDFTPELKAQALEIMGKYRIGPLYTPASLVKPTLMLPSPNGGASWQGAAVDPETGILYVGSATSLRVLTITKDSQDPTTYVGRSRWNPTISVQGIPLVKPPWGRITAIDLNRGDTLWTIANGDTPDAIKNHPALKGVTLPRTGTADASGLLVTKTLLFSGTPGLHGSLTPGQGRPELLAIDKKTGDVIFEYKLPDGLRPTGVPMTYSLEGKQYIVVACGAAPPATTYFAPSELVALALP